jgi:hypothetical protein
MPTTLGARIDRFRCLALHGAPQAWRFGLRGWRTTPAEQSTGRLPVFVLGRRTSSSTVIYDLPPRSLGAIEATHRGADRALASLIGAARCRWKVIRSFIMKSARRSCALAAASSNALGRSRHKITLISTSIWAIPARSSAPTALRCSVSIRAWAHTKPIPQIVLTLTWTENVRPG